MKILKPFLYTMLIGAFVASCSPNPYAKTNRAHKKQAKTYAKQLKTFPPEQDLRTSMLNFGKHQAGTTNFNLRKPNFVIIHHTAQESVEHTLSTFTLPRTQVSSHYVIGRNGEIYQMLNDAYRAWHGGIGKWGNTTDLNSSSIGIELDNNGFEGFSDEQISSLINLLKVLKDKHGIPTANFIGHSDIAPSRKVDPNPTFPWEKLAEEGFGYWYDDIVDPELPDEDLITETQDSEEFTDAPVAEEEFTEAADTEPDFDPEMALRIIGYDTKDLDSAIKAFKLHFIQTEVNAELTDNDLRILKNLYRKYM